MRHIEEVLARHKKIGLQLSGGRDSIACLYLMRPWLDRVTVYWCNTGAAYPETLEIIEQLRGLTPHFVEIVGNQPAVIEQFGIPSDIVPATRTPIGIIGSNSGAALIQDRYSCCARAIMLPLHERMLADGVTLLIRGQKNSDHLKAPMRSGGVDGRFEYLFPLEDWSAEQVDTFLKDQGAPRARFYEVMDSTPDCMTCSAWWENGAAKYLKRYHHPAYLEVQRRLDIISEAVGQSITHFNKEVGA